MFKSTSAATGSALRGRALLLSVDAFDEPVIAAGRSSPDVAARTACSHSGRSEDRGVFVGAVPKRIASESLDALELLRECQPGR